MEKEGNISCVMANIAWNENNWKSPSDNKTNFRWTQEEGNIPGESWNFDFDNPRNNENKILGFAQFKNPPKSAEKDRFLIIFRSLNNIIGFYGNAEIKKQPLKINESELVNLFGDKELSLLLENKIDDKNHEFLFGKERISQGGFNKIDNKDALKIIDESIKLNPNQTEILNDIKQWLLQGDSQMTEYEEKLNEIQNNLLVNRNVILTGAPGTGKTFMAKTVAARLILDREINDYDKDLTEEEKKQVESQIGFVQFHPSYDYTDFVEGLRPKQVDGSDQIGFERKDGVFKKFCEKALLFQTINNKDFLENLNKNPKIWKVSLSRTGENEIRKDCLENNYIRIGWSEYGNIENFDDFENFSNGGKSILRSYQNEMQIGDIVLSCFSAKEIDAIGIITGDYEYKREGNEYPRYRNVKWIVKNIRENIIELNNGKSLTLSTIYKLSISLTDIKFIIEKYITGKSEEKEPTPFVFIIDEINRGEVAKIFGELFYCIDPGYRGEKGRISTQYQNLVTSGEFQKGFFIPENVYIIGTMNDIDRSVESMDFAFRRRFSWIEVKAIDTVGMLDSELSEDIAKEAKRRMKNLNNAIWNEEKKEGIDGLNDAYHIGASYFLKLKNYGGDFGKLWDYHIKGILQEYLRGNPKANEEITKLKAAYDREKEKKDGE